MTVGARWCFKDNLCNLGVSWETAPEIAKIKEIQARVIIGPNGCGKSRLLRALSETLQANRIHKTNILYADFPEMASLERKGTDDAGLSLLKDFFIDRRNTPLYDTLKLISSDPVKGINSLVALSETDSYCGSAVDKVNDFVKPLFGDSYELKNIADLLEGDKELSPGQRSMLYMSIMLGVLSVHYANDEAAFYLLLDEPDQHLHAKAIVDFIKQLQKNLPQAKLWIATHSVHIMAHFKFNEIIYIDGGKVQPNNSLIYDKVCDTMVDTKEMQQFVSFSGLYGFYEFFRECFSEPGAEGDANDKLAQIKQRVRKMGITKILDYGAGKGRFFKLLAEIPSLDYHAFEINEEYHDDLRQLLSPSGKIYAHATDIPPGAFDAVLLINTLHEIPLDQWLDTFAAINRSLKNGGCLFFCETSPLITGEHIENTGYLVLGAEEQRALFGVEPVHLDKKKKLHFSEVPKRNLPVLTQKNLLITLTALKDNSFESWANERENARNAAFYAVQHLNAEKALTQLSDPVSETLAIPEDIQTPPAAIDIRKMVDAELDSFGIDKKYIGRIYLREAISLQITQKSENPTEAIRQVANQFSIKYSSVKKGMQKALEEAWWQLSSDKTMLFGSPYIVPTQMEFISHCARKILNAM